MLIPHSHPHQLLDLVPVEESLDIALLEFVEFRRQRLFDDGIQQLLLVPGNIVMHLRNTPLYEFAEIGGFRGVDNSAVEPVVLAVDETAYAPDAKSKFCCQDVS